MTTLECILVTLGITLPLTAPALLMCLPSKAGRERKLRAAEKTRDFWLTADVDKIGAFLAANPENTIKDVTEY